MAIKNQVFEQYMKILAFRTITDRLKEENLITEDEFRKISHQIDRLEAKIVKAHPSNSEHPRKLTVSK